MTRYWLMLALGCALAAGCRQQPYGAAGANDTAQESVAKGTKNEAAANPSAAPEVARAVAVLVPIGQSGVSGTVYLTKQDGAVHITGKVTGLSPGLHGFHVHEYGDLTAADDGSSAGGHFNPEGEPHGAPDAEHRHVGDLGNIKADDQGTSTLDITDSVVKLNGPHSVVGRAIVVHQGEDHFTQPSGDAGARVAFGVIGIRQPQTSQTASQ